MSSRWTLLEPAIPLELRRDVLHIRIFENPDPRPFAIKVAPVALPGIVFHHRGRGSAIHAIETPHGMATRLPLAFVYGAGTTPSTMRYRGGPHLTIQLILKPHGLRSLLGLDARQFRITHDRLRVRGLRVTHDGPGCAGRGHRREGACGPGRLHSPGHERAPRGQLRPASRPERQIVRGQLGRGGGERVEAGGQPDGDG